MTTTGKHKRKGDRNEGKQKRTAKERESTGEGSTVGSN
jgi:hypothetical protein